MNFFSKCCHVKNNEERYQKLPLYRMTRNISLHSNILNYKEHVISIKLNRRKIKRARVLVGGNEFIMTFRRRFDVSCVRDWLWFITQEASIIAKKKAIFLSLPEKLLSSHQCLLRNFIIYSITSKAVDARKMMMLLTFGTLPSRRIQPHTLGVSRSQTTSLCLSVFFSHSFLTLANDAYHSCSFVRHWNIENKFKNFPESLNDKRNYVL